ncbi:D-glycero-beta-D-manno-heptose-7-phosphate kinase [Herpetosiphon llansteffanensis]
MHELTATLAKLSQQRVLIVGDVMLDEYIWGDVTRISPEAPVPIVNVRSRSYRPGGASNVAASIAALNAEVLLGGVIGDDLAAQQLKLALEQAGVGESSGLIKAQRPTTLKTRIIAHNQQMLRYDSEVNTALDSASETALCAWVDRHIADCQVCILSDYAKGVLTEQVCQYVIQQARRYNIPVVVDPKGINYQRYAQASVITPNLQETQVVTGLSLQSLEQLQLAADQLLDLLQDAALIITRSADGMALYRNQHAPVFLPTHARNVYDVTGAGDTVVAILALALASGSSLEQAMQLANIAAGIVVGKVGTATVDLAELSQAITSLYSV